MELQFQSRVKHFHSEDPEVEIPTPKKNKETKKSDAKIEECWANFEEDGDVVSFLVTTSEVEENDDEDMGNLYNVFHNVNYLEIEYTKDVHKLRKIYAIWLNFGYIVVYLKVFLSRHLVFIRAQS